MSVAILIDDRAPEDVARLHGLQVQLLVHHRRQPAVAVGRDRLDDALEQVAAEALGRVDVADLLPFRLGHRLDLRGLARLFGL